jgi:predicted helicase
LFLRLCNTFLQSSAAHSRTRLCHIRRRLLAPILLSLLSRRLKISKWDIFYYVYGLLHHPGYRAKFADNLQRELPRIPFAPDFRAFAAAGAELARLHLDYEKLEPYPLKWLETPGVPLSYRALDKMRRARTKRP